MRVNANSANKCFNYNNCQCVFITNVILGDESEESGEAADAKAAKAAAAAARRAKIMQQMAAQQKSFMKVIDRFMPNQMIGFSQMHLLSQNTVHLYINDYATLFAFLHVQVLF